MDKIEIDIIKPYPDEILASWIIRMAKFYGYDILTNKIFYEMNNLLFGVSRKSMPNLYVPTNLQYLKDKINLPSNEFFSTAVNIFEKMTILPLYKHFLPAEIAEINIEKCLSDNNIKSILFNSLIKNKKPYYFEIKFCPICYKENNTKYLNREHQIIENKICYKHGTILKSVNYHIQRYFINDNFKTLYQHSKPCLIEEDEFYIIYTSIADEIHWIYLNGITDSLIVIKSKLIEELINLGYIEENKIKFINIDKFLSEFQKYNLTNINYKILDKMLFSIDNYNVNPISYITLIIFLFNNIDNMIKTDIDNNICINLNKSVIRKKESINKLNEDFLFIDNDINKKNYIIVYHKICKSTFTTLNPNFRKKQICPVCFKNKFYINYKNKLFDLLGDEYTIENYLGKLGKSVFFHKECGHKFESDAKSFLHCKKSCPICKKMKRISCYKKLV